MLHFIDFEVFSHDWLCVIQNPITKTETVIINNKQQLEDYYNQFKNEIFVGFNIRHYDQFIFKAILCDLDPKKLNDFIIIENGQGWNYSSLFKSINLNIFDIMPNPPIGLKTLEGFMGSNIKESDIPFDYKYKLTRDELAETVEYCRHDVEETIKVFVKKKEEFDSHLALIKAFDLPLTYLAKTKAQLSALILEASKQPHDDEFDYVIPNTAQIKKYTEVPQWYLNEENKDYTKNLEIDIAGVPHVFGWGGIHGAIPQYHGTGYFINVDVASYYPSLMIEYNYGSRNMKNPDKYAEIYHARLKYKAEHNPIQGPLKIVLNGTYGAMKDKFNNLYDPRQSNNVCVGGQVLLLDLIERLEETVDIIQSNTDGILVKLRAKNDAEANREYAKVDDICYEWEQRSRMKLEFDEFVEVWQKDVNNYVIIAADGSYKSKGAYVKKLSALDNDLPIVNKALINYMINGTPVEQTINESKKLIDFQKIVKLSKLYDYAMLGDRKLTDKTFRVYASNSFGTNTLFKVKHGKNPEKFANTPINCFIFNASLDNKGLPQILDKQWYIDLAKERLKQFGVCEDGSI